MTDFGGDSENMAELSQYMKLLGEMSTAKLQEKLQIDLNKWKDHEVAIAVVGNSGSGKSSLINAVLDLKTMEQGMAEVGITETTTTVKRYRNESRPNLALYDFPGVGITFPRKTYFEKIGDDLSDYDFFLIVSNNRFTENDLWFAKEIHERKKKFYFVRTHIDDTIRNDKRSKQPAGHNEETVKERVKNAIYEELYEEGILQDDGNIFLIDNYEKENFDFKRLLKALIKNSPAHKSQTIILSLAGDVDETINEKVNVLKGRMYRVALAASLGSAVPIPGVGLAAEGAVLYREGNFYLEQLGIDDKGLSKTSEAMGIELKTLKKNLHLKSHMILISTKELIKWMSVHAASEAAEDILKLALPVIGSIISAAASFPLCMYTLNKLLTMCETETRLVHKELIKRVSR